MAQLRPRTNIAPNGTPNFRVDNAMAQTSSVGWPRHHAGEHVMFSPYNPPQLSPGTPMFMYPAHSPYGQPIAPPSSALPTPPAHPYFTNAEQWQQLPPHLRNPAPYSTAGPVRLDPRLFPGHPGYQPGLQMVVSPGLIWGVDPGNAGPGPALHHMSPHVPPVSDSPLLRNMQSSLTLMQYVAHAPSRLWLLPAPPAAATAPVPSCIP